VIGEPPGSADELAYRLRRLVEDAALRARLAAGAHAIYRARFTADAFAADIGKTYASLGFPASARTDRARAAFANTSAAR
jgi:glycosyltransferase involved in cell wall biosynthesis